MKIFRAASIRVIGLVKPSKIIFAKDSEVLSMESRVEEIDRAITGGGGAAASPTRSPPPR